MAFNPKFAVKDPKEITIESYNKTAEDYAKNVAGFFLERDAERFLSYLPTNGLILDIGCGSGRDAKIFTEKGYSVVGVDLSDKMLEIGRKNAPKASFKLMDIVDLHFPENYFDGLWAVASLLHVPKEKIPNCCKKCYDILKPDGVFFMTVKEGAGEVIKPDKRYGNVKKSWSFFQGGELESVLEKSGFTILESITNRPDNRNVTHTWINILCRK